jgi:glyoxylase-like metal-dependent hydrolase (beta-lactamase superfamily II)
MKFIPLSEGRFTIDATKEFIPFIDAVDTLNLRPTGSLLVEIQPFVVITDDDVILLDTGLGFEIDGQPQLYRNLKQAGIHPDQVTRVLLTHLHKDHAGGGVRRMPGGERKLAFPQATYYIQRKELDLSLQKGGPSYVSEDLYCLRDHPQVVLLEGDGILDGYITYAVSGGHAPYHQVFTLRRDGQILFFGGDEAPQLQQMRHRFVAKYDHDGRRAMEWRQAWWEQGAREGWQFLFYHDVGHPSWSFQQ